MSTTGAYGSNKAVRRGSNKASHGSRSYPRGVGVDFRKLAGMTLLNYVDHHGKELIVVFPLVHNHDHDLIACILGAFRQTIGVKVRPDAPPSELAVAVARHFEAMDLDEQACIGGFLERLESPTGAASGGNVPSTEYARSTAHFDGHAASMFLRKRRRNNWAARPGEQVAAKVTRVEENGSWILASVQRFYPETETYDVQDEDDTSKLIRLPWDHVMRLSSGTEGTFVKGSDCMAIFPETTSFYRAKVSKNPVWKLERNGTPPMVKEVIVRFEDDEDGSGRTPHRRVPARYVIPLPSDYFYEEYDDVDLSLAGLK